MINVSITRLYNPCSKCKVREDLYNFYCVDDDSHAIYIIDVCLSCFTIQYIDEPLSNIEARIILYAMNVYKRSPFYQWRSVEVQIDDDEL